MSVDAISAGDLEIHLLRGQIELYMILFPIPNEAKSAGLKDLEKAVEKAQKAAGLVSKTASAVTGKVAVLGCQPGVPDCVIGCMDPLAYNFDPKATHDDEPSECYYEPDYSDGGGGGNATTLSPATSPMDANYKKVQAAAKRVKATADTAKFAMGTITYVVVCYPQASGRHQPFVKCRAFLDFRIDLIRLKFPGFPPNFICASFLGVGVCPGEEYFLNVRFAF